MTVTTKMVALTLIVTVMLVMQSICLRLMSWMNKMGNNKKEHQKELEKFFTKDTGEKENLKAVSDAAFGDKKKFDPLIEKAPSHCVVIDPQGDITFSVSIGKEFGFKDYGSAHKFCQQHVMDCANNGVPMASRWKVRPAFVSIS